MPTLLSRNPTSCHLYNCTDILFPPPDTTNYEHKPQWYQGTKTEHVDDITSTICTSNTKQTSKSSSATHLLVPCTYHNNINTTTTSNYIYWSYKCDKWTWYPSVDGSSLSLPTNVDSSTDMTHTRLNIAPIHNMRLFHTETHAPHKYVTIPKTYSLPGPQWITRPKSRSLPGLPSIWPHEICTKPVPS